MSTQEKFPAPFNGSTLRLTHYGRKSGKPFQVKIWYTVIDGVVWIGSMSTKRSWVKNLRAGGRAKLDFGTGPRDATCRWLDQPRDVERYSQTVLAKYPITSRILRLFVKQDRCAFSTDVRVGHA